MLITVFGRRGSGKTTLIRSLIPKLKKPVVIIDILGNFDPDSPEGAKWTREQKGVNHAEWVQTEDYQEALLALDDYHRKPAEHSGYIVVRDGDIDRAVDYMCSALWAIRGGTLVIDEADAIKEKDAPCFNEAIRYGRNKGIDLITGCRRPAEISRNVTAGADIAYCLTTQEPRDIDYYRDFLGENVAETLARLPQHHGVYRDFQTQKTGLFSTDKNGKIQIGRTIDGEAAIPKLESPEKPGLVKAGDIDKKIAPSKRAAVDKAKAKPETVGSDHLN